MNYNIAQNEHRSYYKPEDLRNSLRLLWNQFTIWARFLIISKVSGLDDVEIVTNRFLEIPGDLANLMNIYYDDATTNGFIALFRREFELIIQLIDAIIADDSIEQANAESDLRHVIYQLTTYLNRINPYFNEDILNNLFLTQIDMITEETKRRINRQYVNDIFQYDFIEYHALMIADYMWQGFLNLFY